jgi:predicted metal-dependent enzyme (double-stranded beta helix superfamily)
MTGPRSEVASGRPAATAANRLDSLDEPVRTLFEQVAIADRPGAPDLDALGAALVALASDLDYVMGWVERMGDLTGAMPIHAPARGPRLSIVHRPEGEMGAIHDHGTWVAISPIVGLETHRRYRIRGGGASARPEVAETLYLEPTQMATLLPPDDLHDHGHMSGHGAPAYVLIMTGDDQTQFTRNEWDLATGRHRLLLPGDGGRWLASQPMPDA